MTTPSDPHPGFDPDGYARPYYQDEPTQPAYGQPAYGQPAYGPPAYGPPAYGQNPSYGAPVPVGPTGRGKGRIIALSAAAVVVIGGGAATYVAVSSSDSTGGAGSPTAAVQNLVSDLNNSDLLGVLNDLPPGERAELTTPLTNSVTSLKHTGVLSSSADLNHLSGVTVKATGLTYGSPISIYDDVKVVEVTGGTLSVSGDLGKLPFGSTVSQAIAANGDGHNTVSKTTNLATLERRKGHPLRIATQEVDGTWYPSLMYTIADNAVTSQHLTAPLASARIANQGADSPDDAVLGAVQALVSGDVGKAIGLANPDSFAVLHDYGQLIVDRAHIDADGAKVTGMTFADTTTNGVTHVQVKSVHVQTPTHQVAVSIDGTCLDVDVDGQTEKFCTEQFAQIFDGSNFGRRFTDAQHTALVNLASAMLNGLSLDTSQVNGSWYIDPLASVIDLGSHVLSGLSASDLAALISLGR